MITRERVGTEIGLMKGRIRKKFLNGRDNLSSLQTNVSEKTRRAVRKTDYYVHENAWTMMAISAGLAFAAGFLLSRRNLDSIVLDVEAGDTPQAKERIKRLNSWEMIHSAIPLALFVWKTLRSTRTTPEQRV
jgi:ElaB/YqjD/DUF883 family membrane-anchored ribosome-binding protein